MVPGCDAGATPPASRRGAALAYVVAVIAVLGILVGLGWRLIRANDRLVAVDRWDIQAGLLAQAGLDYAMDGIGPPGPSQDLGYATESLHYNLGGPDLAFDLTVRTWGLYARARSTGRTALPGPGRTRERIALVGQALDLGGLPAIALLDQSGNMVLAGNAQVTGPVLLWKGDVRKATDYKVRWKAGRGHVGPTWDSTAEAWARVRPDFRRAEEWIHRQESMLSSRDWSDDPDYDSGTVSDLMLPDSGLLADTLLENVRILASKHLRVGSGVRLRNCKLLSANIVISGEDARLEEVLAFAGRNLEIQAGTLIGGQFLARDTLLVSLPIPMQGTPVFYVQGRVIKKGPQDAGFVGAMLLEKAQGEGIFLAAVPDCPFLDHEVRLESGPGVKISGLLYCGARALVESEIQGSLIARSLIFEYEGTIYGGHLMNAQLSAYVGKRVISAPLLFPGFHPLALGMPRP